MSKLVSTDLSTSFQSTSGWETETLGHSLGPSLGCGTYASSKGGFNGLAAIEDTSGEAQGEGDGVAIGNVIDGEAGGEGDGVSSTIIKAFLFFCTCGQTSYLWAFAACFVLYFLSEAVIGSHA